jgi:hypothetical protein
VKKIEDSESEEVETKKGKPKDEDYEDEDMLSLDDNGKETVKV